MGNHLRKQGLEHPDCQSLSETPDLCSLFPHLKLNLHYSSHGVLSRDCGGGNPPQRSFCNQVEKKVWSQPWVTQCLAASERLDFQGKVLHKQREADGKNAGQAHSDWKVLMGKTFLHGDVDGMSHKKKIHCWLHQLFDQILEGCLHQNQNGALAEMLGPQAVLHRIHCVRRAPSQSVPWLIVHFSPFGPQESLTVPRSGEQCSQLELPEMKHRMEVKPQNI